MEWSVFLFAVYIYVALAFLESALEKCSFRRVRSVAVIDACTQTNHAVIEAEHRFTGYEVGRKVFKFAFHQLHGKHAVFAFQRAASGEVFCRMRHGSAGQRTIEQLVRQMYGSGTRQTVPVPSVFIETAVFTRRISHDLNRTIALVASVAVVFLINFRTPNVGSITFQSNHPVASAEDTCRTVVVYEEALRCFSRGDSFFLEESSFGSILVAKTKIICRQVVVEFVSFSR